MYVFNSFIYLNIVSSLMLDVLYINLVCVGFCVLNFYSPAESFHFHILPLHFVFLVISVCM